MTAVPTPPAPEGASTEIKRTECACKCRGPAVLNAAEIEQLCSGVGKPLISPWSKISLQPASYDLRLGRYARVGKRLVDLEMHDHTLRIPPHEVVYVETEEVLHMPNDLVATFGLRMKWVLSGLTIPPQTQIDPGYKGKLFILMFNLSNAEVYLARSEHIISVEFRRTSPTRLYDESRQNVLSLPDALKGLPPVQSGLAALSKELKDWKVRVEAAIVLTLGLITLLLTVLTLAPMIRDVLNKKQIDAPRQMGGALDSTQTSSPRRVSSALRPDSSTTEPRKGTTR